MVEKGCCPTDMMPDSGKMMTVARDASRISTQEGRDAFKRKLAGRCFRCLRSDHRVPGVLPDLHGLQPSCSPLQGTALATNLRLPLSKTHLLS